MQDSAADGQMQPRKRPADLPAATPVGVVFRHGEEGRLTVIAPMRGVNNETATTIERTSSITAESLQEWNQRLRHGKGHIVLRLPLPRTAVGFQFG